ncbi:MAG: hypothetical protein BWY43_00749 [candidate division WS2 bacterium ADurb.Bin280]|uniref:DUF4395 domain-containing protein n=1 Tax=candidate division WS2 bacterium ADurb.Bin280 TaxID=1852829 RepID=A0A1V5SBQ6_9BACT|nr:MAG: hypothetical protein BWY43_00749 [candidate division WS2 bacterium ADurb.Bin280]
MEIDCLYCQEGKVDENVARLNAAMVVIMSILFIFTTSLNYALVILVFDFFVKVFAHPRYAPTSYFSRYILHSFKIKPKPIFAPPKLFAAKVGLVFSLSTFILYLVGFEMASYIVCSLLAIFAFLEASIKFCMGCWLYSYLNKIRSSN